MTTRSTDVVVATFGLTRSLALQWTAVSTAGFVVSLAGFLAVYAAVTGDDGALQFHLEAGTAVRGLALVAGGTGLVVAIHELCHGLAIRAFGGRPRYGVGVAYVLFPYAFATADTRFTRNQFVVVVLAPLVLVTAIGVPSMLVLEWPWLAVLLALNAGGAVGDAWMAAVVLGYPASVTVLDTGTGLEVYGPPGLIRWEPAPAAVVRDVLVGTAAGCLFVGVAIWIVVPTLLLAGGVESRTVGDPDSPLFVFDFERTPDGGLQFATGSGGFVGGVAAGLLYAYGRARRRRQR